LWWTKVALGQVFSENFGFSCFSTIIFTITRGWHNRPGVAAVSIASQSKQKKHLFYLNVFLYLKLIICSQMYKIH
jgi:hypothetical protein